VQALNRFRSDRAKFDYSRAAPRILKYRAIFRINASTTASLGRHDQHDVHLGSQFVRMSRDCSSKRSKRAKRFGLIGVAFDHDHRKTGGENTPRNAGT
jgi:hypothetical protein